ncbi:MAG: hypothetical protein HQK61_07250 [Desulfamplus sp.]|nr:hypothetical protein [Desulfamplus sp.]
MENKIKVSDIRGMGRLAVEATNGITDIVEDMHYTVSTIAGLLGKSDQNRTKGITGLVYRNIRAVSGLVGDGMDAALGHLESLIGTDRGKKPDPGREAVLAALNGVLGDHLAASENPLAINMQLRRNGKPVAVDQDSFSVEMIKYSGKIALMMHGLCMNDLEWNRHGHDHGEALARDLGYLPVYLNYNTGLHVSENGRLFSQLMETFTRQLPQPIEIAIIAHSMGGLVCRSGIHYGKLAGHTWINHLRKIVFLGTPHHGAPLAKGGNWIDILLEINPYSAPFARLGKIRSSGLTDLRCGNLIDEDWDGQERFCVSGDNRTPVPLPDGVQCYTIGTTIGDEDACRLGESIVGDGLVTLNSALGYHDNPDMNLCFPVKHQWVGRKINHMDLLNHPEVYQTIKQWLETV